MGGGAIMRVKLRHNRVGFWGHAGSNTTTGSGSVVSVAELLTTKIKSLALNLRGDDRVIGVEAIVVNRGRATGQLSDSELVLFPTLVFFSREVRSEQLRHNDISRGMLAVGESPLTAERSTFSADTVESFNLGVVPENPKDGITSAHHAAGGEDVTQGVKEISSGGEDCGPANISGAGTGRLTEIETTGGGRVVGRGVVKAVKKELEEESSDVDGKCGVLVAAELDEEVANKLVGELGTRGDVGRSVQRERGAVKTPGSQRVGKSGWRGWARAVRGAAGGVLELSRVVGNGHRVMSGGVVGSKVGVTTKREGWVAKGTSEGEVELRHGG